ncbi:MAG TPA: hypothetical protein VG318_09450 [Actinomycetota bacterium]|nr:hypothetical protein [Actinomycetota bacterium]
MRKTVKLGGAAVVAAAVLVGLWLIPNPLTPCGSWRGDVVDLANDNNAVGREKSFAGLDELSLYTDELMHRAGELGERRPPLCPVPGSLNPEDSGFLYWLVVPDAAPPDVFEQQPDER